MHQLELYQLLPGMVKYDREQHPDSREWRSAALNSQRARLRSSVLSRKVAKPLWHHIIHAWAGG